MKATIDLPDEMAMKIKACAKQERRTEAELIREAVEAYLSNKKYPLPRILGTASSGKITGEESEDWLYANWDVD